MSARFNWFLQVAGLAMYPPEQGLIAYGQPWALGTAPGFQPGIGDPCRFYESVTLDPKSIRLGSSSINVLTGDPTASELSFRILLPSTDPYGGADRLAPFFLSTTTVRRPAARITSTLAPNGVTFTAEPVTGASLDAALGWAPGVYPTIYIGREAFVVEDVTGSTVTILDTMQDPSDAQLMAQRTTFGATGLIGQYATRIETHEPRGSGVFPPFNDDSIYTASPFLSGREVQLFRYDGTNMVIWWRGVITGKPKLSSDGLSIDVRAVDLLKLVKDRRFNTRPVGYTVTAARGLAPQPDGTLATGFNLSADTESGRDWFQRKIWYVAASTETPTLEILQVAKCGIAAFSKTFIADGAFYIGATTGNQAFLNGDTFPLAASEWVGKPAYELLVSDPLDGTSPLGVTLADPTTHPFYSTEVPPLVAGDPPTAGVCQHPLHLVLCLLGGIPSNLPEQWTMGFPADFVDVDGIAALARLVYADIATWPGIVWGVDGRAIDAEKAIAQILRGIGCGLALSKPKLTSVTSSTPDGEQGAQITVRSLFAVFDGGGTIVDSGNVLMGRGAENDLDASTDAVVVTGGHGISGKPRVRLVSGDGLVSRQFPYSPESFLIDAPGMVYPDLAITAEAARDPRILSIRAKLASLAALVRFPPQIANVAIALPATGPTEALLFAPGDFILVQSSGYRLNDTAQLSNGTEQQLGFVLGRSIDLGTDLRQSLSVMWMPYGVTFVGPAATVKAGSSSTAIKVDAVDFIRPVDSAGVYVYDSNGNSVASDAAQFALTFAPVILVLDANLEPATDPATVTGYTGTDQIDVAGGLVAIGGGAYTPAVGDTVTLADYADASIDDVNLYAWLNRAYYAV